VAADAKTLKGNEPMNRSTRLRFPRAVVGCIAGLATAGTASAGQGKGGLSVPPLPKYQQECAACHVPYPPGLLPAASWQRIMNDLPRHFGVDASLDAASARALTAWLDANAGTYKRVREPPAEDRITRSGWFIRKHDEVHARTWNLPAVRSAAHCGACHGRAEQGDFNERSARIPR
jgi:mono/diheme cytochrome c family protein